MINVYEEELLFLEWLRNKCNEEEKFPKTIHAHLSGTLKEYLYLSPAYIVKYATAVWGKEHGYELIHYGGGTSSSEDNSLYQFKLNFTKDTIFDFYVGSRVWNKEVYEDLVSLRNGDIGNSGFFPRYRE